MTTSPILHFEDPGREYREQGRLCGSV